MPIALELRPQLHGSATARTNAKSNSFQRASRRRFGASAGAGEVRRLHDRAAVSHRQSPRPFDRVRHISAQFVVVTDVLLKLRWIVAAIVRLSGKFTVGRIGIKRRVTPRQHREQFHFFIWVDRQRLCHSAQIIFEWQLVDHDEVRHRAAGFRAPHEICCR